MNAGGSGNPAGCESASPPTLRRGLGSGGVHKRGGEMKRTAALLSAAFAIAAIAAGSAGSATSKSSFAVLVAPTTTAASNGLTLQTEMTGSFNVATKTASGKGTYSLT